MDIEKLAKCLAEVMDSALAAVAQDKRLQGALHSLAAVVMEATRPEPGDAAGPPSAVLPDLKPPEPGQAPPVLAERLAPERSPADTFGAGILSHLPTPVPVEKARRSPPPPEIEEETGPLPELTLGRTPVAASEPVAFPARWTTAPGADLVLVAERCRLKADGARWAAQRRRLLNSGANYATDIEPQDKAIIARAKAVPDCFLWMCHPTGPSPLDLQLFEHVAGCFDAVAEALQLLQQVQEEPEFHQGDFENGLDLLAEAQSALRAAISRVDGPSDPDQVHVYHWLKETTSNHHIFIQRHMRSDDPADPTRWQLLHTRIVELGARLQHSQRRDKQRKRLLGKVRHKISQLDDDAETARELWKSIANTVDDLVTDGLPPSNRELRELLLPVADTVPEMEELPRGFELAVRELDRYLASYPTAEAAPTALPAPEVAAAAKLLDGRSLVMIGGERRPAAHTALEQALHLRELIWIETREHESINGFAPFVARPDVAAVILAIRWSSHSYGEVKDFCDRHNKPLVRLPGGYNPNQVASQIMAQCSDRLNGSG